MSGIQALLRLAAKYVDNEGVGKIEQRRRFADDLRAAAEAMGKPSAWVDPELKNGLRTTAIASNYQVSGFVPVYLAPPSSAVSEGNSRRCEHGVRYPHECRECEDGVDTETAVAWYAYESVAAILEPHIERDTNPDGFLPASITDAVQMLLEHRLSTLGRDGGAS